MVKIILWIKKSNFLCNQVKICFDKVKKDCFKFIKSQETSKEKFRNKDKMIKVFFNSMCFWIAKKANNKKPYLLV